MFTSTGATKIPLADALVKRGTSSPLNGEAEANQAMTTQKRGSHDRSFFYFHLSAVHLS